MRGLFGAILAAAVSAGLAGPLAAEDLVPAKRLVFAQNTDLPGGDIASLFDTTIEACQTACAADGRCDALTFNARVGACFLKQNPGAPAFYQGAYSARLLTAAPGAAARAAERVNALPFLWPSDFQDATAQARGLGARFIADFRDPAVVSSEAAAAEGRGSMAEAVALYGTAAGITDAAPDWAEFARANRLMGSRDTNNPGRWQAEALSAALNAFLRAEGAAQQHTALVEVALVLEPLGRGRQMVQALRLAQAIQSRDDTAALLDDAIGKYGFRISEHEIQSDAAEPRICATFTEPLSAGGVDYATFVAVPEAGLTVERSGDRQLCVGGLAHGQRLSVTFREGLPAADGQTLAKSVEITGYVRDRAAAVRFPGRGYVLPRGPGAALPVETVNTETLELSLFRVSDRNLLRAIQDDYFGTPMAEWAEQGFADRVGDAVWTGTAEVALEINRDVTTRLPMDAALEGLPAGIYALKAAVPGTDPYVTPAGWQWFVVSDLGLSTFWGADGLSVAVIGLSDAQPRAGVTVDLLGRANAVLGTAQTDAQGFAAFPAGLTQGTGGSAPAMLVARQGEGDLAFLSLTEAEFDLSDRGVAGRDAAGPVDVFLTTERGAYRAGETVHVTALARDGRARAIEGLPLTAVIKRPDGVEWARQAVADQGGGYVFAQPIAGTAPRGVWRIEMFADLQAAPLASRTFLVEDFLPERIDFDLALPETPLRLGDAADLTVAARYLFGAPGAGLRVEGEVLVRAADGIEGYPNTRFGRHDTRVDARIEPFDAAETDDTGAALIPAVLPEMEDPGRPLEARFTVRVAEGSGRPVERQVTKALTPSAPMIGIRPLFDAEVPENTEARFALVAVDPDLAPLGMDVTWSLTRIETRYQWYQQYGNWYWEPVVTRTPVAQGSATLSADGAVEIGASTTWGEYELAVGQVGGTAAASTTFYAGWYVAADVTSTPDTLDLSLDKPSYAPGETAVLRIVPRAAGTALVTVLSDRVVAMQTVAVAEGETLIRLPVTEDWGQGVYVTASVLRPMDVPAGRNPGRAMGLAHASVAPGAAALTASLQVPAEADPRGPLPVAVRVEGVAPGETAWVTVAAVDQGILNLTRFTPPDPQGHYFGQRKLGVGIRDLYGRLIDGLNGAEGIVRSGGDAGAQARLQADPPTEELVAYFSGPLTVGADGMARTSFDLPAFNGTVKVMAVAWSRTGVGQASADVLVRDPVVVTASVPRFLSPGDESRLLLEIVHATGPAGRMGLDVSATGLRLGAAPSGVDLAAQGKAVLAVPLTAADPGLHKVEVALTTPEGRVLRKTLTLPVRALDPEVARISRFDLAPGATFTFDQAALAGLAPGASATLAIGPVARLNAPGLLAALDRYPYGCTEQMTSKAMPLLYLSEVAQAMALPGAENIGLRIDQTVAEVLANQSAEGAFGLWGPSSGEFWLDAFVTDFLSRARAQGHAVPDRAFRAALDNLRNQVNYQADFDMGGEALAYALMVLAREGAAAIGDLRYYADVKADAFATPTALAQLGAALAAYGDPVRADRMFAQAAGRLNLLPETEQVFRADFGTGLRDAAAVLALAAEAGSRAVDAEVLTASLAPRSAGTLSTQEATWMLLATRALVDGPGAEGVTLNGLPPQGPLVRLWDGAPVAVANGSSRAQTITVTAYGIPTEPEPAGGNGYAVTRAYYTLDGQPVDPAAGVAQGTRLVVVLDVTPFARGEARLMVSDPLPAGFEIDNPNLVASGDVAALDWLETEGNVTHAEFRQDRFLAAFDRGSADPFRLAYIVRAVSPGRFHHPAASVEDMYRPDFRARGETGRVTVTE
jgi:hypothetical protein